MKYKSWLTSIAIGIMLGGLLFGTGLFFNLFSPQSVRASGYADNILTTVLTSHTKWNTLQGDAQFTWYDTGGGTEIYDNKFVISQPSSVYVNITNLSQVGFNEGIWISDGKAIYLLDKSNKTYTSQTFTITPKDLSVLPQSISQVQPDTVYIHPMAMRIGAPIMEYIYSSWYAQSKSGDTFTITGSDKILDRTVWVINHVSTNGDSDTAWIDQTTGIILQFQQIINGKKNVDMKMVNLQVDKPVDTSVFVLPTDFSSANPQ